MGVLISLVAGFSIVIGVSVSADRDAPPVPAKADGPDGSVIFTGDDVRAGEEIFLRYGLMDNGTICGHGAYLGPDFSAQYLHAVGVGASAPFAQQICGKTPRR